MATSDLHNEPARQLMSADCTCYHTCGDDSKSGAWHQHEDEPCPVHDESIAPMVG
jgi:hypothetical protein